MILLLSMLSATVACGTETVTEQTAESGQAQAQQKTEAEEETQSQTLRLSDYEGQETLLTETLTYFGYDLQVGSDFYDWMRENLGEYCVYQIAKYGRNLIQEAASGDAVDLSATESGDYVNLTNPEDLKKAYSQVWYKYAGATPYGAEDLYLLDRDPDSDLLEGVYEKDTASGDAVVLDFTGDIGISEGWPLTDSFVYSGANIYNNISSDLIEELQSADILMINNEFTYSTRGTAIPGKAYTFRANPSRVKVLTDLGVDVANLANNHAYDYQEDALLDTMDTLTEAGIPYVGAGENLDQAKKPVYFIAAGRKIAIVAATQIERSSNQTHAATEDSAGVLKCLHPEEFIEEIEEAAAQSDYVIAYVHWGTENTAWYGADQEELAGQFAEAGADAIIGGHTHCLQGFSYVEDVPVVYSLGNFWFNTKTIDTGVAQLTIDSDGEIAMRFIPCKQASCHTTLLTGSEGQRVINYMDSISDSDIEIDEDGWVSRMD